MLEMAQAMAPPTATCIQCDPGEPRGRVRSGTREGSRRARIVVRCGDRERGPFAVRSQGRRSILNLLPASAGRNANYHRGETS